MVGKISKYFVRRIVGEGYPESKVADSRGEREGIERGLVRRSAWKTEVGRQKN